VMVVMTAVEGVSIQRFEASNLPKRLIQSEWSKRSSLLHLLTYVTTGIMLLHLPLLLAFCHLILMMEVLLVAINTPEPSIEKSRRN
jgi:hypothetical protein